MIVNTIPFPDDAGEIFTGSPDENTTVKFEIAHEVRVEGLYVEARAREFRVVEDRDKDEEVATLLSGEMSIPGSDAKLPLGGGKLYRVGYSAAPTGRVWSKSQTVPWSLLLSDREAHVREAIKAMIQNLVAVLVQRAVTMAVEKILPTLPPAEKATDPLHNKTVSEDDWKPWPEFLREEQLDAIKEMNTPGAFAQQYQQVPFDPDGDHMEPEEVTRAARRFMRTVRGKPLFVSELDADGRATGYRAAAEAKLDGTFKLPIDEAFEADKPAGPTCDKEFATCRDVFHNHARFGGDTHRRPFGPCPFKLGDTHCGVDLGKDGESFSAVITSHRKLAGGGFAIEMQRIKDTARDIQAGAHDFSVKHLESFTVDGDKATIEGAELKFRGRVVGTVSNRIHDEVQISITDPEFKKLLPWSDRTKAATDEMVVTRFGEEEVQGASPGCDSCWGTGYFKGAGGPCPEGCKPPRS